MDGGLTVAHHQRSPPSSSSSSTGSSLSNDNSNCQSHPSESKKKGNAPRKKKRGPMEGRKRKKPQAVTTEGYRVAAIWQRLGLSPAPFEGGKKRRPPKPRPDTSTRRPIRGRHSHNGREPFAPPSSDASTEIGNNNFITIIIVEFTHDQMSSFHFRAL